MMFNFISFKVAIRNIEFVIIYLMGNKLGLEIEDNQIKVAYIASSPDEVKVIDGINSQYLQKRLELKNGKVLFFCKFTIEQFNQLR